MRKLLFGTNLTLDGCCDHTKVIGDDGLHYYYAQLLQKVDTLLYGRKTYELMVPFWPDVAKNHSGQTKAINDFAQAFDSIRKIVVFSRSLDKVAQANTRIVRGTLQDEILKLKQEDGGDIMTGGVDIPSQLIQLGLIDEYHFVIQPRLAGAGRRLLENVTVLENLKLIETTDLGSSGIALRYGVV